MREKCDRKGLPQTAYSALHDIRDAIGIRIVCCFLDDIYRAIDFLKSLDGVRVVEEKDYIRHVKPNGYRSYHVILELEEPYEDVTGAIRVISMPKSSCARLPWIPGPAWNIR